MKCNQCGDQVVGTPGYEGSKSSGGWCGSRRVTRRWFVCQDCNGAGEYQQHLYRLSLRRAELEERDAYLASLEAKS